MGQGGNAKIEIKFIGNEVNIPFTKSPSGGKVKIILDDNIQVQLTNDINDIKSRLENLEKGV